MRASRTLLSPVHLALIAVILLGTLLQVWGLEGKSLWIDEEVTVYVVSRDDWGGVLQAVAALEGRPPLYYLLLHGWTLLLGDSDFSLRLLSVTFCVLSLALLFALGRTLGNEWWGLLATYLLVISPAYVLFGRMVRAYPLTVLAGLSSCLFFWWILHRPRLLYWLAYFVSSLLVLYTDYFVPSLLLAQNLFWLLNWRRYRPQLWRWVAAQLGLGLSLVFWLPMTVTQGRRIAGGPADLALGLKGLAVKTSYILYSLSMGETIFPWHPAAVAGLLLIAALFVLGVVVCARRRFRVALWLALLIVVPMLYNVFIISGWLFPNLSFITLGSRTLFIAPFFCLLVAAGVLRLRTRPSWLAAALVLITATRAFALWNHYADRQFLNPLYLVPTREMVQAVGADYQPGDVIVCDPSIPFDHYHRRLNYADTLLMVGTHRQLFVPGLGLEEIERYLRQTKPRRVWLINLERDRSTEENPLARVRATLEENYTLARATGYVEQDELYRELRERLMNRPGYRYKASVLLYARSQEG